MFFHLSNGILADVSAKAISNDLVCGQMKLFHFFENLAAGCSTPGQRWVAFIVGAVLSVVAAFIGEFIISKILLKLAQKTENTYDDRLVEALHYPFVIALTATGIYFSTAILAYSHHVSGYVHRIYLAVIILLVLRVLLKSIKILSDAFNEIAQKTDNIYSVLLINLLTPACKTVVWVLGVLFVLDNVFQFNIASLLAGAGIAAMAVAFAAQNTIANIFGAIALIVDRPFQIGHRIQVDGKDGIVEAIGLRSTKLRSLDGTLWCIPNKTMTDSPILNFSTRPNFKYSFVINLTYNHNTEQLRRCKEMLHKLLDNYPLFDMEKQPPRITFSEIADYSLDVQALCWFQTKDFMEFTLAKEELNFKIMDALEAEGLEMAYPTQSIYVENLHKTPEVEKSSSNSIS